MQTTRDGMTGITKPGAPVLQEPVRRAGEAAPGAFASDRPATHGQQPAELDADLAAVRDRVVLNLMQRQVVSGDQVRLALRLQRQQPAGAALWRALAQQADVDRDAVYREAARTYAFREADLDADRVQVPFVRETVEALPVKVREQLFELNLLPVAYERDSQTKKPRLVLVTHDPTLPAVQALLPELKLERFELRYAPEAQVRALMTEAFPRRNEFLDRMSESAQAFDLGTTYQEDEDPLVDRDAIDAEISRSVLINLFEAALVEAVRQGASDLHIFPNGDRQIEIRFRIDGRLTLWHVDDKMHPEALLAVIKDSAINVDRFERETAQDGYIQRHVDGTLIRFRVSVLPIAGVSQDLRSESIVIRVLDDRKVITDLTRLGLSERALERFHHAINQPHGMVILTGPTGSGKSTTLVAALHQVVTPELNVLTVEDPVEYIIPGVRQIKLGHRLNLEGALRAILRHDPDVVMVGEMRDRDTAELAIKLANTGHLTFSTLHTNDAASAVSRLYKMGIEPFLLAHAINLVVAQRLVRTLCPVCKQPDHEHDPATLAHLGFTDEEIEAQPFFKPGGRRNCAACRGTGYKGRRAVSETLYFSPAIRRLIVEAKEVIDEDAIRRMGASEGMLTLADSAREIVREGATSIAEMLRVVFTD